MSFPVVALCYGSALLLALFLLWYFGVKGWYWHLLSVAAALVIGLTPLPPTLNGTGMTLLVGWLFVFLLMWGILAPVFMVAHVRPHFGGRPH